MNDCSNAEMRDQLPDLLHDRLAVSVRDVVVAHVADCIDCREELELLRGVHVVLVTHVPRVNVAQIVAALPKPPVANAPVANAPVANAPVAKPIPVRRMMRMDWRIAAAVTFLAVGGSSVALLNRAPTADRAFADSGLAVPAATTPAAVAAVAAVAAASSAAPVVDTQTLARAAPTPASVGSQPDGSEEAVADVQAAADVSPGGRFSGLTEAQLKALLGDIGDLPAVPLTEPDPVTIQVVNSGSTTTGGW